MGKRDTSKKRNSILDAAVKAFEKYGFENTSMDKIAEEAGASKRTVYNHFPSKEELFHAVIEKFNNDTTARREMIYDPKRSVRDQLSEYLDREIAATGNPNWLGLKKAIIPIFMRDMNLSKQMMAEYGCEQRQLEKWMVAAGENGTLKIEDPVIAASVFTASISGVFFWPAMFLGPFPENEANRMKEELLDTFLAKYGV